MAITPEHVPHIPHLPLPDIRGGLRWVKDNSLQLGLALAIAAGSTYFIASHDQKPPIKPTTGVSDTIKPPESEFVVVPAIPTEVPLAATAGPIPPEPPTPEPTKKPPSPTAEPTKTVPTPEAKKDVPCTILPQEYCSQGEVIYSKNSLGWDQIYIGFKKLPKGVPVFAGEDGQTPKIQFGEDGEYRGARVMVMDPDLSKPTGRAIVAIGDLTFDNMLSLNVKQGAVIGHIGASGVTNLGGYNLLITIRERAGNGSAPAEDLLRQLFPEAFTRPSKTLPYDGPANPTHSVSVIYSDGKVPK